MQETDEMNRFLKNAEYFYDVCKDEYEKDKMENGILAEHRGEIMGKTLYEKVRQ